MSVGELPSILVLEEEIGALKLNNTLVVVHVFLPVIVNLDD